MTSMWYRMRWLFCISAMLSLVAQSALAASPQQSSKTQTPSIIIKQKVSTKHLPVKQVGQAVRTKSAQASPQAGASSLQSTTSSLALPIIVLPGITPDATPVQPEEVAPTQEPAQVPASVQDSDSAQTQALDLTQEAGYQLLPQGALPSRLPVVDNLIAQTTLATQQSSPDSPYYRTTWLTYYGRPNVPVMGILGEYDIDTLTQLLRQKAAQYDAANGPDIGVTPAFHLVYGMASRDPGFDGSYLLFLDDDVVMAYINRAAAEGFAVILDIQMGALSAVDSMQRGLEYLAYPNVHLGIDPEFAMVHPGQPFPGVPIGYITGQQVNSVQSAMQRHMDENGISGTRILLVHQFAERMIVDKQAIDPNQPVALTLSVDGYGAPVEKIRKYNLLTSDYAGEFSAFKLFYRWDEPLLTERQALGVENYSRQMAIEIMPNLIIYQ